MVKCGELDSKMVSEVRRKNIKTGIEKVLVLISKVSDPLHPNLQKPVAKALDLRAHEDFQIP